MVSSKAREMPLRELIVEYDLDTPPSIAWDALTDPELVSGWLGDATVDPVAGGRYAVAWVGRPGNGGIEGRITEFSPFARLAVATPSGAVEFRLDRREGGLRGTWTRLHLTVTGDDVDRPPHASVSEGWHVALVQLDELLRGRPVDWRRNRRTPRPARDEGSA